ncbi:MAG: thrombospondin type 3 repeat-containing protein [Pseudomonadota bacterium]|nr:thrombospondin type 3 repeat-containing protein [Pseudomonadota bacterium]
MRTILLLALAAPSLASASTTGTVTVLLKNTGVGNFSPGDPIRVLADADSDAFDRFVNAPSSGTASPGESFTAPFSGLLVYDGVKGTYQVSASFLDASGTTNLPLASGLRFPGTGSYYVSKLGVTSARPGAEHAFDVANTAPAPFEVVSCLPDAANPTQNLALSWGIGASRAKDFDRYSLQRGPASGGTWTTIGTYVTWGPTTFTDTSLSAGTSYRYRVLHQDRYDAVTPGLERVCATASGDLDGDGQVSTAFGGTDCDDASTSIYRGAPEVINDGVDQDCDGEDLVVLDADGDGLVDTADNCPGSPNADQANLDLDGAGDACDPDDDNDGVADTADICPRSNDADQADLDGDLSGDVCDDDDDDDGVDDVSDVCPRVPDATQSDLDHDLYGDACDGDDDGDGVGDLEDVCPALADDQADADADGIGDACDPYTDSDGDLLVDEEDNCPLDANEDQLDTDADAAGDACDVDDDNDGAADDDDLCPVNADPLQEDAEADGLGNACDEDDDNDDVLDEDDNCVFAANAAQADLDGDTTGDACDDDDDGDGVDDATDNCVGDANTDQDDNDLDGAGDTCDDDDDADGWADEWDNCAFLANANQADLDEDALGDVCDPDDDDDLALDAVDNCPIDWNGDQLDTDGDADGDACDDDDDDDGIGDEDDRCSTAADPEQTDLDCDGRGDVCDDDVDGDGVPDAQDTCPGVAAYPIELVDDGCPDDACDLDTWIGERDSTEIARQMVTSLRAQASAACTHGGTNQLNALGSHVQAQRGRKVSAETADLLLSSIAWIEAAEACEETGVGCEALDPCGE